MQKNHHSLNTLTASQTAKLLVMHHGIDAFGYKYESLRDAPNGLITLEDLASMSGEDLERLYDERSHDDAVNRPPTTVARPRNERPIQPPPR